MTDPEEFAHLSIEKMHKHSVTLDSHSDNLTKAAVARIALEGTTGKKVLQEVADRRRYLRIIDHFYGDDDPIPRSVLEAVMMSQRAIANATNGVVLMMALGLDIGN